MDVINDVIQPVLAEVQTAKAGDCVAVPDEKTYIFSEVDKNDMARVFDLTAFKIDQLAPDTLVYIYEDAELHLGNPND